MNTSGPLTRTAEFRTLPGQGDLLADRLLHAASLLAETAGCQLWLVHRDEEDPDAILDAPDLSKDADLLGAYDLDEVAEARYVRPQLGAVQCGLMHYRLRPGGRQGFAHRHRIAQEIYVTLTGGGHIMVDGEPFDLTPLVAVRVAPASARELHAGPDGLEVLAFGSHSPGDGEMVNATDDR